MVRSSMLGDIVLNKSVAAKTRKQILQFYLSMITNIFCTCYKSQAAFLIQR